MAQGDMLNKIIDGIVDLTIKSFCWIFGWVFNSLFGPVSLARRITMWAIIVICIVALIFK